MYWKEWDRRINEVGLWLIGLASSSLSVPNHFLRIDFLLVSLCAVLYMHEPYRSEVNERRQKLFSRRKTMTLEEYSELSALEEGRDRRNTIPYDLGSLIFLSVFCYSCCSLLIMR